MSVISPSDKQMPKNNKRRNRKPRAKSNLVGFSAPRNLFPQSMTGHGTYSAMVTYSVPNLGLAEHVFRLNSIYDPDYTSITGRSIGGFAQASVLYGKYRVFKAEIIFDGAVDGGTQRCFYYCVPSNDLSLGTDPEVWAAQRNVWMAPIKGGDGVRHRMIVPIHTAYGVPKQAVQTEDDFSAVMTGNPNNGVYLHVGMYNVSGIAAAFSFTVRIVYHVRLELPTALA